MKAKHRIDYATIRTENVVYGDKSHGDLLFITATNQYGRRWRFKYDFPTKRKTGEGWVDVKELAIEAAKRAKAKIEANRLIEHDSWDLYTPEYGTTEWLKDHHIVEYNHKEPTPIPTPEAQPEANQPAEKMTKTKKRKPKQEQRVESAESIPEPLPA